MTKADKVHLHGALTEQSFNGQQALCAWQRDILQLPDIVRMELEQQGAGALHPLFGSVQGFGSTFGLTIPC